MKALITKTSQDPHSYEASAQDKLAVSKAGLVVENGGGYDDFVQKIADETKIGSDHVVKAVDVSGPGDDDAVRGRICRRWPRAHQRIQ